MKQLKKHKKKPIYGYNIAKMDQTITYRSGKTRRINVMRQYKKPLTLNVETLKHNPNKISYIKFHTEHGYVELFSYEGKEEQTAFLLVNNDFARLNKWEWGKLQSGIMKMGKKMGWLK